MSAKASPAAELSRFIDEQLQAGTFSHAYFEAGFLSRGEPVCRLSRDGGDRAFFDLASLTKAIATTSVFFWLLEQDEVSLDDPLGAWLPAGTNIKNALLNLSARELLAHNSGLPAWRNFYVNRMLLGEPISRYRPDAERHIEEVLGRDSVQVTDKVDRYSDVGFILLGYALEKVTRSSLECLFRDFCFQEGLVGSDGSPLLFFNPCEKIRASCVPTSECRIRGRRLIGEVHDENCAALGGVAGHAGLFGTGAGLAMFLKRFASTATGTRVFAENARLISGDAKNKGLCGYRPGDDEITAAFCKGRAFGHYGFTGTAFWVEPVTGRYVIFLTNRVVSGRVNQNFRMVRKRVLSLADELLAF